MKTVVITGSARGLGLEMAKVFLKNNINVVISDLEKEKLKLAKEELLKIESEAKVRYFVCDVTKNSDVDKLIKSSKKESPLKLSTKKMHIIPAKTPPFTSQSLYVENTFLSSTFLFE